MPMAEWMPVGGAPAVGLWMAGLGVSVVRGRVGT